MVWRKMLLAALVLSGIIGSAKAGVLFNRKSNNKQSTEDRNTEVIKVLRGDPDERRRAAAAEELGKIDLRKVPAAGAALLEAVQRDPSAAVRTQAAESLGKLRPLTVQVGRVLEEAFNADPAQSVRLAARNSLSTYVQSGFQLSTVAAREQPKSAPNPLPANVARNAKQQPIARNTSRTNPPRGQTNEPPLAPATPERETVVSDDVPLPATPIGKSQPKTVVVQPEPPLATSPKPPPSIGPVVETPGIGAKPLGPTIEVKPDLAKPSVDNNSTPIKPAKPSKSDEGPVLTPPG